MATNLRHEIHKKEQKRQNFLMHFRYLKSLHVREKLGATCTHAADKKKNKLSNLMLSEVPVQAEYQKLSNF